MSSVLDVSSLYDSYASRISSASAAGTSDKIGGIGKDSSDEELMEACKSFESYFVQKMIEEAKKTVENCRYGHGKWSDRSCAAVIR